MTEEIKATKDRKQRRTKRVFQTVQESFWAGEFGEEYLERNCDPNLIPKRTAIFTKVLNQAQGVKSILELGANIGQNLISLHELLPECTLAGLEINNKTAQLLGSLPYVQVFSGSIFDFTPLQLGRYDLTFTFAVLIHINPARLIEAYRRLYECTQRYILVMEYYNPTPTSVLYRGRARRLFKRDFAGELLAYYPDLHLVDYGFLYHRDPIIPVDDFTWFLLEK